MNYALVFLTFLIIPLIFTDTVGQESQKIISDYCQYKKSIDPNFECPTVPQPKGSSASAKEYLSVERPSFGSPQTSTTQNKESGFDFLNFDSNIIWIVVASVASIIVVVVTKAYLNCIPSMPEDVEYGLRTNFSGWNDRKFEELVADVYKKLGFHTTVTPAGPDQGVDVIARGKGERVIIQAKRWNSNVGSREVRETVGAMPMYNATKAIVITTHDFSVAAYEVLQKTPNLELVNMEGLRKLILQAYRKSQDVGNGHDEYDELIRCEYCGKEYHRSFGKVCPNCNNGKEKQEQYEDWKKSNYKQRKNDNSKKSDFSLKECYKILNVSDNSTSDEIKKAYRKLTNIWHPDKHIGLDDFQESQEKMRKINTAYDKLQESGKVNNN